MNGSHARRPHVLAALCASIVALSGGAAARAASITVCATGCDHTTIYDALQAAADGDTVLIGAGTFTETVAVERPIRIRGVDAESTIIDGEGKNAVFWVEPGVVATISNLTITGGTRNVGSGILNQGALTVRDVTIRGNHGPATDKSFGGAIYNVGSLSVRGATIVDNDAEFGGAILNAGTTVVSRSTITGNRARSGGGALYNYSGTAIINNSIVSENRTAAVGGGAFFNASALAIANSSIVNNRSTEFGGAVFGQSGGVYVTNSTFSGNESTYGGGGIYLLQGEGSVTSSTFTGNKGSAGGGLNVQVDARLSILNTILTLNGTNCFGELRSEGANIDSGVTCNFSAPGDQSSTDPRLRPLANNGGYTLTHALPADSPAVDQGDLVGCIDYVGYYLTTDQRGYVRDVDGNHDGDVRCDVGAYEFDPADPGTGGATPTPGHVEGADVTACATGGTHTTIGAAIAAVRSGGTVGVCAGVFHERLTIDKPLTLKGVGATVSIVDGQQLGPVVTVVGDVAVTVTDMGFRHGQGLVNPSGSLTVRRSTIASQSSTERGGIQSGGTLLVEDSRIADNVSLASGGGIGIDAGQATIKQSVIEGNTAGEYGGGIDVRGGTLLSLVDVTLSGNEAANGGGLSSVVPFVLTGSTVADNFATYGAGIFSRGKATITDAVISGNQGDLGGGIYAAGELNLTGTQVYSNFAFGAYGYGGGVMLNEGTLSVIRGAFTDNQANLGGGLYVRGNGTATDVAVTSNEAGLGGGLYVFDGRYASHGGRIAANAAVGDGGGVYAQAGQLVLDGTAVTENTSVRDGGGLFVQASVVGEMSGQTSLSNNVAASGGGARNLGTMTLADLRITGNQATGTEVEPPEGEDPPPATGGLGGGVLNEGTATIARALIANCEALSGGGVANQGTLGVENATLSGNLAERGGGGLFNAQGSVTLRSVTLAANDTDPDAAGGGSILTAGGATTTVGYTILAAGPQAPACKGAIVSAGHNLASDGSCGLTATGDQSSTEPLLAALAANGGSSQTHALLDGSPAIDAGDAAGCPGLNGAVLAVDQRGSARPADGNRDGVARCDVGAFERSATGTTMPTATPPVGGGHEIYLPSLKRGE
ncbi:MAG: right-handed parallel beta-helix repeat-containing protein [Ardenticatenales bacterium]